MNILLLNVFKALEAKQTRVKTVSFSKLHNVNLKLGTNINYLTVRLGDIYSL